MKDLFAIIAWIVSSCIFICLDIWIFGREFSGTPFLYTALYCVFAFASTFLKVISICCADEVSIFLFSKVMRLSGSYRFLLYWLSSVSGMAFACVACIINSSAMYWLISYGLLWLGFFVAVSIDCVGHIRDRNIYSRLSNAYLIFFGLFLFVFFVFSRNRLAYGILLMGMLNMVLLRIWVYDCCDGEMLERPDFLKKKARVLLDLLD